MPTRYRVGPCPPGRGLPWLSFSSRSRPPCRPRFPPVSRQQLPSPEQAQEILRNQPQLVEQLRERLSQSGLTPDQVRSRLRAAGYPENMLDDYVQGADTTVAGTVRPPDARRRPRARRAVSDRRPTRSSWWTRCGATSRLAARRARLASSCSARTPLRADSLADSVAVLRGAGLKVFGIETFRRATTRFQPAQAGPVDENYRLGPGDCWS